MKAIRLILAVLLAACLTSSRAQDTWTQKAAFGGAARNGAVGFSIGDKGYMGTGRDLNNSYKTDFWEYDPVTDVWSQKANYGGVAVGYGEGFSIGNKGYVGVGLGDNGNRKDFWEFDPLANTWIQKADFGGTARYVAASFAIGNKGYIGTGWDGASYKKDFWEYDPSNDTWTQIADFGGVSREYATGFTIGSKAYIGTGLTNSGYKNDFWEYDPSNDMWTARANYPGGGLSEASSFAIGNKGYIGLGYTSGNNKDFWEYDPSTDAWTKRADFGGNAMHWAASFSVGGKGYIGTGFTGGTFFNYFWEYTPEGCSGQMVFADADNDSYGDATSSLFVADCIVPDGYVLNSTDCNDANAAIHPGACDASNGNGIDENCDGIIDNGFGATTYYTDADGDGYGAGTGTSQCSNPGTGYSTYNTDCNDNNAAINPGAYEIIGDGIDNNCNGIIDETKLLIASYPFNGNANDETGNGYNGMVDGATLCDDRFGNAISAYNFDGSNDQIVIGQEPNFPAWDTYSVSLWFLNDGGGTFGYYGQKILSKAQFYTDWHLEVGWPSDSGIGGNLSWWASQGGFDHVSDPNYDYRDNKWHHVVLNKKSPTEGDMWVDGVLLASSNTLLATINDEALVIGFTTHGDGFQRSYWSGKIDDIQIFNNILSPAEIMDLFGDFKNDVCEYPTNLSEAEITSTSVKLKWDDNPEALGYVIKYNTDDGGDNAKVTYSKSNAKTIYGLLPGTTYFWRVKSVCSDDPKVVSDWSEKNYFTTTPLRLGDQQLTAMEIYPNPVSEKFMLDLRFYSTTNQPASIYIMNTLGQVVYSSVETVGNGELSEGLLTEKKVITMPSTVSSGWYVVRVVMSDQVMEKKLLYQK
ncbi:MAG: fibronectin type III domain-containing protein [Chitinophagaceae bacterium]|nr:fibronectin type III domain-containing protein [Chitinophagaceae bacterium]